MTSKGKKQKPPRVVMFSLWKNDEKRRLRERAEHLLSKTYQPLRWVWVVGDCDPGDMTLARLLDIAAEHPDEDITIVPVETPKTLNRYERLSLSANAGRDQVRDEDDLWLTHESDIESPPDVIEQLLAAGKIPIAAWPVLESGNGKDIFYDVWAFRKDGKNFAHHPPHCEGWDPLEPFPVDSVGTVWIAYAEDLRRGVRCYHECCVELCNKMTREYGRQFWAHPGVIVRQPRDLWEPHHFKPVR